MPPGGLLEEEGQGSQKTGADGEVVAWSTHQEMLEVTCTERIQLLLWWVVTRTAGRNNVEVQLSKMLNRSLLLLRGCGSLPVVGELPLPSYKEISMHKSPKCSSASSSHQIGVEAEAVKKKLGTRKDWSEYEID